MLGALPTAMLRGRSIAVLLNLCVMKFLHELIPLDILLIIDIIAATALVAVRIYALCV